MSDLIERAIAAVSPSWGVERARNRALINALGSGKRHYEAASHTSRTEGWNKTAVWADQDRAASYALPWLRGHARDLIRNNGWARRAQYVIANNTVSWGIVPKAVGAQSTRAQRAWKAWAGSTKCSASGRQTFAAMQHLVMRSLVESGEVLIRRKYRQTARGEVALELAVLEADYLDGHKTLLVSDSGGPIINGVEFDGHGRRTGYWLFPEHPGSGRNTHLSSFVPAMDVLHIYSEDRPGQTRGVSWLAAAIVPLKDLADLEDAELVKQKVAACFAAFVTDVSGEGAPIGEQSTTNPLVATMEPGMVAQLPVGQTVTFGSPPQALVDSLPQRTLRRVCAALGVTYEEVAGDWSTVNFSSARMARLAHWGNVHHWQQDIIIPLLCQPVWEWFVEAAWLAGLLGNVSELPTAEWTPPPMPMIEPAAEGGAYNTLIRNGIMTLPAVLREQGIDPDAQFEEIAKTNETLDKLGIRLDCDPRTLTAQGQAQMTEAPAGAPGAKQPEEPDEGEPLDEPDADAEPVADEALDAKKTT